MDNTFFPHRGGGSINVKTTYDAPYNYQPDQPISLDPREVISEWSDDALASLSYQEVYAGMQVYCLSDKKNRICRWIPDVGKYSGLYCIWDVMHTSDEDAWVDVRNMEVEQPATLLSKRISEAETKKWRFSIDGTYQYYGFYDLGTTTSEINENLNNEVILNKLLSYFIFNTTNDDELVGTDKTIRTHTISTFSSKSEQAKTNAISKNFVIFVPVGGKQITSISFDAGTTVKDISNPFDRSLEVISTSAPYILNDIEYKAYVVTNKITSEEMSSLTIKLTYA